MLDASAASAAWRELAGGAMFEGRRDLELGARGGTSWESLRAVRRACQRGFVDLALLPVDQLSARPVVE